MESGKLDEELRRMSDIADAITPDSILLCNESFASTNEREGSEIARQVVRAMLDKQRQGLLRHPHVRPRPRLPRRSSSTPPCSCAPSASLTAGARSRLLEGEPLPTSYGEDSYRRIFGVTKPAPAASPR